MFGLKGYFSILIIASFMGTSVLFASVPDDSQTLVVTANPGTPPLSEEILTKQNIEKYLPFNLTPTNNSLALSSEFQTKFEQRVVDGFFDSNFFKKTPAGRATETIKQVSEKSVSLGTAPGGVPQQVKFQVMAIQRQAQMAYTGYFNSTIVFLMDQNLAAFNISKPLSSQSTLTLTNSILVNNPQLAPNLNFTYNF